VDRYLPTFRANLSVSSPRVKQPYCPSALRNIPEERRSRLHPGGSVKSRDERREWRGKSVSRSCDRASLMYSFKYNQQDATLYNILYYYQCSTCFRRFLRSSSGAQETVHTASGICQACLLLPLAWVNSTHASSEQAWLIPSAVCTVFELLMMGGETARNV